MLQSNSAGGLVQLMGGGVQHTDEAVRGRQLLLLCQSGINMVMVTWSSVRTMHTSTSSLVSSHTRVQLKQSFNAKYKVVRDLVRIECPLSGREPCQVPRIFMSLKYFYLIELSSLQRHKKVTLHSHNAFKNGFVVR